MQPDGLADAVRLHLYGMTTYGGSPSGIYGNGVVFKISTPTAASTPSSTPSPGVTGAGPVGSPTLSGSWLFGTNGLGRGMGWGALFRINTNGTEYYMLHSFGVVGDGASPSGSLTYPEELSTG